MFFSKLKANPRLVSTSPVSFVYRSGKIGGAKTAGRGFRTAAFVGTKTMFS